MQKMLIMEIITKIANQSDGKMEEGMYVLNSFTIQGLYGNNLLNCWGDQMDTFYGFFQAVPHALLKFDDRDEVFFLIPERQKSEIGVTLALFKVDVS